jgi:hypothetical protein
VVITSQTSVPQSSSISNAAPTSLAAIAGDGGSGCGGFCLDHWAAFVGLVLVQSHRTAAFIVPLMIEWIWRTVDAAIGLHARNVHFTCGCRTGHP